MNPSPFLCCLGFRHRLKSLLAISLVCVHFMTLGILLPPLMAILIACLHSSSSCYLKRILRAGSFLLLSLCIKFNGCAIFSLFFFFCVWKVVITKITIATSFCEINYFKWAKKTKHLRREWLRNWKESMMLCYSWLIFGSFIFLLSNIRAIELRGREHPAQEIDGVWRRWGGAPSSRSLNPSVSFPWICRRSK